MEINLADAKSAAINEWFLKEVVASLIGMNTLGIFYFLNHLSHSF